MRWASYIDPNRSAVHIMPNSFPPHDWTDCWCHPSEEPVTYEYGFDAVLVSHNHEL